MLRDVINEIFLMLMGIFLFITPFSKALGNIPGWKIGNVFLFLLGTTFLMMLIITYTVGFRFDNQFKSVFLDDKKLGNKLPLSFVSADWYLSLRVVRAMMYARNIVLPKGTKKNWIQESWFNGYDFKKNARWFDVIISYVFFIFFILLFIFGASLGLISLLGKNYN